MRTPLPTLDVLDAITIPVHCTVPWDEMKGDVRSRFCANCQHPVHDVSEMTAAEAVNLLTEGEKAPCLRIYKRRDGRVLTADCATTRDRVWKWLDRRSAWAAALFAVLFLSGCRTAFQGLAPQEFRAATKMELPNSTPNTPSQTATIPPPNFSDVSGATVK